VNTKINIYVFIYVYIAFSLLLFHASALMIGFSFRSAPPPGVCHSLPQLTHHRVLHCLCDQALIIHWLILALDPGLWVIYTPANGPNATIITALSNCPWRPSFYSGGIFSCWRALSRCLSFGHFMMAGYWSRCLSYCCPPCQEACCACCAAVPAPRALPEGGDL
jgi:hypothetical protein